MRRSTGLAPALAVLLAGCASRPVPPPPAVVAAPHARSAVVVAARRLAPADLRAPVLQTLSATAASTPPSPPNPGVELVVQTQEGRILSCIAHAAPPPHVGATVLLQSGADCAPMPAGLHVAAEGAIR
jgi:hypothetical protein